MFLEEIITLAGALVLGSFTFWAFWGLCLVAILVLVGLTENEHQLWASVLLVLGFASMEVTGIFNIYDFAIRHPLNLLEDLGAFVVIAIGWGAIKWWSYCRTQRRRYNEAKTDFLKAHQANEFTPELRVEWTEKLKNNSRYDRYSNICSGMPNWRSHKEKIGTWMGLWPFSMLGTICSEFLVKLWQNITECMGGIYDDIAARVWQGTETDLASEEDRAAVTAMRFAKLSPENKRT